MRHVQNTNPEADIEPAAGQLREGRCEGNLERDRLLPAEPGGGGDHRGRRFVPEFRDQGHTLAIVASGPSASSWTADHFGRFPAITVNDSWRLHPGCEAHYGADRGWWALRGREALDGCSRETRHFCSDENTCRELKLEHRQVLPRAGLSVDPLVLCAGGPIGNSGAQAINLAYLTGAKRILLFGFDMKADAKGRSHWFGGHPQGLEQVSPYPRFIAGMMELALTLDNLGIQVLNANPDSALPYFRKLAREQVEALCAPTC